MARQKLPPEKEMVREEERERSGLPFREYGRDTKKIRSQIQKLEKAYDQREKVIEQIMEYGTGIETEKALRMYPTSVLRTWEKSLQAFQKAKLAEK